MSLAQVFEDISLEKTLLVKNPFISQFIIEMHYI